MKVKFDWRELIVYIAIGFFIGFLISAVFAPGGDICGSKESLSSPLVFISIATGLLIIFFFVSKLIEKDLYFIPIIIAFAILFEYFIAQPYIVKSNLNFAEFLIGIPLVHLSIFYVPRILVRKIFKK